MTCWEEYPRVLFVHNRYQYQGGEDTVVQAESTLLRQHRHPVGFFTVDNTRIPDERSLIDAGKLALSTVWSRAARRRLEQTLRDFDPDVVHFHNTFPLISPAAYSVCQKLGIPVVQTLHNYRLLCLNSYLFRDGQPCRDCIGKTVPLPGIRHACYRDSRQQSTAAAAMLTIHRLRGTWDRDVDRYIALSKFARQQFIDGGLPAGKIAIKSNFLVSDPGAGDGAGGYVIFVGRLDETKGIRTMLDAWERYDASVPLRIAGDGPLAGEVRNFAARHPLVTYLGRLDHTGVIGELQEAMAMIFPSPLFENFPMSIVESFACGTPVIASATGSTAEIVNTNSNGLHFLPGDPADLAWNVNWLAGQPETAARMRSHARSGYLYHYTARVNYDLLTLIYAEALAGYDRLTGVARQEKRGA